MNTFSANLISLCTILGLSGIVQAQFPAFPDSSASWCFDSAENSDFVRIQMIMGPDPDTLIGGQTYKRIEEYNINGFSGDTELVQRFYVRSDSLGKGYVMLLDSVQEYLAVDVGANAGDTLHNVLTAIFWGSSPNFELKSVVVDSVVVLENNGVSVTRQFVHALG